MLNYTWTLHESSYWIFIIPQPILEAVSAMDDEEICRKILTTSPTKIQSLH